MTNKVNFTPLKDRVLVKRVEQEERSPGGIIIPDTAKEKPMEGEVIAVGTGSMDNNGTVHPLELKVGDRIMFGKWGGTEIKLDGVEYLIIKEQDVLGIINK